MSVAPRWKRRADEIAEAIGDELSVNGTVSIGNDVNLSVATISALANAITNVLNPLSIAASVWGVHGDYGVCRATQDPSDQNYWFVYSSIGHQVSHIHDSSGTTIPPSANSLAWVYRNNNQWQLFDGDVVRNVSVVSTNTTPVHVQVRNIAGGFTAMGSDISTSMKLTAQPVSIADTVNVKTDTGDSVAISGTVNLNVGSSTVPISNPNNITVPVVNSNSVTVPVSLGSVTVPVKATAAGIPQNANGISLYLPVDANHGLTIPVGGGVSSIPVANTNNVTVAVSGGTTSIPISGGTASVPIANTNNVTIPVTASGTVLDVKIVEVANVAKTSFHEATETALNDATGINTVDQNGLYFGFVLEPSALYNRVSVDGTIYDAGSITLSGTGEYLNRGIHTYDQCVKLMGSRVFTTSSNYATHTGTQWFTVELSGVLGTPYKGYVSAVFGSGRWTIRSDDSVLHTDQILYHEGNILSSADAATKIAFYGHRVVKDSSVSNYWFTEVVEV